jgi:regulator of sigma E protease
VREQQDAARRRFGLFSVDGRVAYVEPDTVAAERGLLKDKHVIVAVDGKPVRTPQDLDNAFEATPDAVHVVGVVGAEGARVIAFRMLPHPKRELGGTKVFGVRLTSAWGDGATIERTVGPAEALQRAVRGTGNLVVDVLRGFGLLFSGKVGIESLGGPITIAKMSGQAAQVGADVFIQLMGLISVNLAIINLLPVPVLDGGHLMIFSIEAITRRKMSLETRMKITKVGIAFVALLMLVAIGNDVLGLF